MGDFSPAALKRPLWIRFDPEDRDRAAPQFCLENGMGQAVCLSDFREDFNLVVYFVHDLDCGSCLQQVESLGGQLQAYQDAQAKILIIIPGAAIGQQAEKLPAGLPILYDTEGVIRRAYAGLMAPGLVSRHDDMLFVLDQFGAPYAVMLGVELDTDSLHHHALAWLEFISIQCPE